MERRSREMLLVGIALAVMAALFAWPTARWLVRLQLVSQIVPSPVSYADAERRVTESNPQDFHIQYARTLTAPSPASGGSEDTPGLPPSRLMPENERVERLRFLEARFPNEPALYAHILRYATQGQVHLRRREQDELSLVPQKHAESDVDGMQPEYLAEFDRDAAQGEHLDSDNAYFPLMRAVGLYEAGRDADAIAAIHRAGDKRRYEDYTSEEVASLDRFTTLSHGESGALPRVTQFASLLFPQYAQLRAVCRMGVVSAVHAEEGGNAEEGFAIRRDLAWAGELMRVQGHTAICNLVGIAITSITTTRPGGVAAVSSDDTAHLTDAQRERRIQAKSNRYYDYLRRIGHADEARWMQAEQSAGRQAKNIISKAAEKETGWYSLTAIRSLCLWWAANLLTLTNAIGLLILGAFAAIAAQISPGKRLLMWRGVFTGVVLIVFGLWLWNMERSVTNWVSEPFQLTANLTMSSSESYSGMEAASRIVAIVLALALPLGMLAAIGVFSLCTRVPLATGIGRGLRAFALPVACVLFLAYAGQTMGTLSQEAQINAGLHTSLQSEGAAMAASLNQPWPDLSR